jgi:hypothetical protein
MPTLIATDPEQLKQALRRELLRLSRAEDALAVREAQAVPYWAPMPASVAVHRRCAVTLRAAADRLLPAPAPSATPAPRRTRP